jgi:lysozyme
MSGTIMLPERYLNAMKAFEGFTPRAAADYAQLSNGYGTKARHAGEVIDRAEADRRFKVEVEEAERLVDRFAPDLDEGTKAALTSLTYNAGTSWMRSGLGASIKSGDLEEAAQILTKYNRAGGKILGGLVSRRLQEAAWMGGTTGTLAVGGEQSQSRSAKSVDVAEAAQKQHSIAISPAIASPTVPAPPAPVEVRSVVAEHLVYLGLQSIRVAEREDQSVV